MTSVYGSYDRMMMTIIMTVIMATTTTTTTTAIMMMMMMMMIMMMMMTIHVAKVTVYLYLTLDFPCLHDIVFLTSFDKNAFQNEIPPSFTKEKGNFKVHRSCLRVRVGEHVCHAVIQKVTR